MNELAKKIFESSSFDSVLKEYFKDTFNSLIELRFKDIERDIILTENEIDFFYSISIAIQELSLELLNESFNDDDEYMLVDHINAIKLYLSGQKKIENNFN